MLGASVQAGVSWRELRKELSVGLTGDLGRQKGSLELVL